MLTGCFNWVTFDRRLFAFQNGFHFCCIYLRYSIKFYLQTLLKIILITNNLFLCVCCYVDLDREVSSQCGLPRQRSGLKDHYDLIVIFGLAFVDGLVFS